MWHSATDPLRFEPNDSLHMNQSLKTCAHHVTGRANCQCVVWSTDPRMYLHLSTKVYTLTHCNILFKKTGCAYNGGQWLYTALGQ